MTFAERRRAYSRATRRAALSAGGITAAILMLPLLGGSFLHGLDLSRIDLGLCCAIKEQLAGDRGLWLAEHLGNGAPLFARPAAQLAYPIRWLELLLPPDWGVSFSPIVHLAIAVAATAWLARTFRTRPFTAACTGLAFAFCGTVLDLVLHSHYVIGAAWLPLVWAATRRYLAIRGSWRHLMVASAAMAACLLGGEPQAYGITVGLAVLEAARHGWQRRTLRLALRLVIAAFAAFGIGLIQWAGTLAELSITLRQAALPTELALRWAFEPMTWPAVLWPGYLHEPVQPITTVHNILVGDIGQPFPWNRQPYMGSILFACVFCGVFARRAKVAALVMGGALILALGDQLGVLPILLKLFAPLALFRYPAKYLVVAMLAACVVAGSFADLMARAASARRQLTFAGITLLGGELVALILVGVFAGDLDTLAATMDAPATVSDLPHLSSMLRGAALQSMIPLAVGLILLHTVVRARHYLVVLVVVDLLIAAPSALHYGPPAADMSSPLARALADVEQPVVCFSRALNKGMFQRRDVYSPWGRLVFLRALPYPELNACDSLTSALPYSPLCSSMLEELQVGVERRRAAAARALGCTHLVAKVPPLEGTVQRLSRPEAWWPNYLRLYDVQVYTIDDPLPRVFVARHPRLVANEQGVTVAIGRSRTAAAALAVIDDPLARLQDTLPDGRDVSVESLRWPVRHRAELQLGGSGGAVVGLRTSFQVGWRATQAGDELPVVRVAGAHVGAVVREARRGPVVLTYHSPHLGYAITVAALSVLAMLGCVLWERRAR